MSRYFAVTLAVVLFSTVAWARAPKPPSPTTKAQDRVAFDSDVKVGGVVLKAGEYLIACDAKQATFRRVELAAGGAWEPVRGQKPIEVAYQGQPLPEKKSETEVDFAVDASGAHVLRKLYLSGSNVEYDFSK